MQPMKTHLIALALAVAGPTPVAAARRDEWPQFRGPSALGVADGPCRPERFSVERDENVAWRAGIPGLARSSPIVWKDAV